MLSGDREGKRQLCSSATPLHPWVILKSSGAVVCDHCTCMAGLGEVCSRVGELLYWFEYKVQKERKLVVKSMV